MAGRAAVELDRTKVRAKSALDATPSGKHESGQELGGGVTATRDPPRMHYAAT